MLYILVTQVIITKLFFIIIDLFRFKAASWRRFITCSPASTSCMLTCATASCTTSWRPTACTVSMPDSTVWRLRGDSLAPNVCVLLNSVSPVDDKCKSAQSCECFKICNSHYRVCFTLVSHKPLFVLSAGSQDRLKDCWSFLQRHALLLSSWPNLCIQQALNEPPETSARTWAQGLVGKGGVRVVEWLNNDHQLYEETRWGRCLWCD